MKSPGPSVWLRLFAVAFLSGSADGQEGLRLAGTDSTTLRGRLEIFNDTSSAWETLCSDGFDQLAARVACRQLGLFGGDVAPAGAFGPGVGAIWLQNLSCAGTEWTLTSCFRSDWVAGGQACSHSRDAGVTCDVPVRLVGGDPSPSRGRVEIFYNGQWAGVCQSGATDSVADVVCRQLGFAGGRVADMGAFGPGPGRTWLDNLNCTGMELGLSSCVHGQWGVQTCRPEENLGVTCMDASHWEPMRPFGRPPSPRYSHTMVAMEHQAYVFAGVSGRGDLFRFDPGQGIWDALPAGAMSSDVQGHSATVIGGWMYVFGGKDVGPAGMQRNDLVRYFPANGSWERVVPQGPPAGGRGPCPRYSHTAVAYEDAMYVFGGYGNPCTVDNDCSRVLNDLHMYSVASGTWRELAPSGLVPAARRSHTAVVYDGAMYVFGGFAAGKYRSDLVSFNFTTNAWLELPPAGDPPVAKADHTAVVYAGSMYIFGGTSGALLDNLQPLCELHRYTFDSGTWQKVLVVGVIPQARMDHSAAVLGGTMFVFGGKVRSGATAEMWSLRLEDGGPGSENNPDNAGSSSATFSTSTWPVSTTASLVATRTASQTKAAITDTTRGVSEDPSKPKCRTCRGVASVFEDFGNQSNSTLILGALELEAVDVAGFLRDPEQVSALQDAVASRAGVAPDYVAVRVCPLAGAARDKMQATFTITLPRQTETPMPSAEKVYEALSGDDACSDLKVAFVHALLRRVGVNTFYASVESLSVRPLAPDDEPEGGNEAAGIAPFYTAIIACSAAGFCSAALGWLCCHIRAKRRELSRQVVPLGKAEEAEAPERVVGKMVVDSTDCGDRVPCKFLDPPGELQRRDPPPPLFTLDEASTTGSGTPVMSTTGTPASEGQETELDSNACEMSYKPPAPPAWTVEPISNPEAVLPVPAARRGKGVEVWGDPVTPPPPPSSTVAIAGGQRRGEREREHDLGLRPSLYGRSEAANDTSPTLGTWTEPTRGCPFLAAIEPDMHTSIHDLMEQTWLQRRTRDRLASMPVGVQLVSVQRVQNGELWARYAQQRLAIQQTRQICTPLERIMNKGLRTSTVTAGWDASLDSRVNEVYLWHGTTQERVNGIISRGFCLGLAGTRTGAMYGDGVYLAECASKSDEYAGGDPDADEGARPEDQGVFCMILCRVVLGEPLHMTAGGTAAHLMIKAAIESKLYDSVVGDREASVGTYREFVVYKEGQVYPEYVVFYQRRFD